MKDHTHHHPDDAALTGGSAKLRRAEALAERQAAANERARLLEAVAAARADAERANRSKDEFVALVSHELRTPLNAILGWSHLLLQGKHDPATVERALEVIARNTRLQAQLISDLLDISRIASGKLQLEVQAIDLRVIAGDVIETMRQEAQAKRIHITVGFGPGAAIVAGDPARLQQVIWNLLSNAVKFTPAGGRVDVTLNGGDATVDVIVSDTGVGIRADVLPQIFDRFYQADRSTTRRFGGLGLGLSIVKHIVELHGGCVCAESAGEEKGATFRISFPVCNPRSEHLAD